MLLQDRSKPTEATAGRVSADAGIDQLVVRGILVQFFLQMGYPALISGDAVFCRKTVSQYENVFGAR